MSERQVSKVAELMLDAVAGELRTIQDLLSAEVSAVNHSPDAVCKYATALARIKLEAARCALQIEAAVAQAYYQAAHEPGSEKVREIVDKMKSGPKAPAQQSKGAPGDSDG